MHLTRSKASRKLPITRKGTKYVVRASSHSKTGVPVVIAIREIIGLAKNANEVREMIKQKSIKINGKVVKDLKESVRLFNILEVGKSYKLSILPTKKFSFEETKDDFRIGRVDNKKMLKDKKIQLNLHDGSNVISKDKVAVGDSVELDFSGKIKKIVPFEKGKDVLIISGKSVGLVGKVESVKGRDAKITFKEIDKEVVLAKSHAIVI